MKTVTVKYGSEKHPVKCEDNANIGAVVANTTAKAVLGYGDNVKALVSGVEQTMDSVPSDGSLITLETKLNQKAE
jgi:hypothetical protein